MFNNICDNVPSFEEMTKETDEPKECEKFDPVLLRHAPWLAEGQFMSMIMSESPAYLDAVMYHLITVLCGHCPIRVILTKKSESQFVKELTSYVAGWRIEGAPSWIKSSELRKQYEAAVEKIKTFDLKYIDARDWPVEDLFEWDEDVDFCDAVVIFDSFGSMKSKVSEKWELSRMAIGAKLQGCLTDFCGAKSVLLFERTIPGLEYWPTYAAIDGYLDGKMSLKRIARHHVGNGAYWELQACIHSPSRSGCIVPFVMDVENAHLIESCPEPDEQSSDEQSSNGDDEIPF